MFKVGIIRNWNCKISINKISQKHDKDPAKKLNYKKQRENSLSSSHERLYRDAFESKKKLEGLIKDYNKAENPFNPKIYESDRKKYTSKKNLHDNKVIG